MSKSRWLSLFVTASLALTLPAMTLAASRADATPRPAASLRVSSSAARPGGKLQIVAVVAPSGRVKLSAGTVTVHFASGDVTATLQRPAKSNGTTLRTSVPVPTDQPRGAVSLDVTITLGGATLSKTVSARIVAPPAADRAARRATELRTGLHSGQARPAQSSGDQLSRRADALLRAPAAGEHNPHRRGASR